MLLMANNDGTWRVHDETYDVTIHCSTKEEQERVCELLKNKPIPKEEVLEVIKEVGSCDAIDDFGRGWDMASSAILKNISERF